jgi:branched-chain amino acid transport system permease protein
VREASVRPRIFRLPRSAFAGTGERLWPGRAVLVAAVVGLAAGPLYMGEFQVGLIGLGITYGLFAFGLDIAWGRAGIISIGHAVLFGLGAYGVAIAQTNGMPAILGAIAGIICAVVLGALIGAIGLRPAANPSTMAVLTLALTLLAERAGIAWVPVTGGSTGLLVDSPASNDSYYWICLAATLAIVIAVWLLVFRRPFGNRLAAIRLNERRAEHMGIPIHRERVIALTLSAAVSAIAGALAAPWMTAVTPGQVGILLSTQVLVWLAVGGRATLFGPFLGAIAATWGQDALAGSIGDVYLLILGVLFVLSVMLVPKGVAGLIPAEPEVADTVGEGSADAAAVAPRPLAGPVLAADGIVKRFEGNLVLDHAAITVRPGEIVCLIGPNGAGKTTLLNVVSGAITPDAGTVTLAGTAVTRLPPHLHAAAGMARTFQVPSLFPGLTVGDHLVLARQEAHGAPLPSAYADFARRLGSLPVEALSLSDRRSLEIAMAMCARPAVLLLDEPAAGLAFQESRGLVEMLKAMRRDIGCAIVCVEHDMEIVRGLAERVVCLHRGRVLSEGTMDEISADAEVRRAYLGHA